MSFPFFYFYFEVGGGSYSLLWLFKKIMCDVSFFRFIIFSGSL
jgi:hypothetical protein